MKVKPIEPESGERSPETLAPADKFFITENDDGSISFELIDGTPVRLREMLTEDVIQLEQFALKHGGQPGNSAIVFKLITLLCTGWGEKPTISYAEMVKLPIRELTPNLKRLEKALEFFRLEDVFGKR